MDRRLYSKSNDMKKLIITLFLAVIGLSVQAQNLKFGKPSNEEIDMTVYEKDPEASAVVLCHLTTVKYQVDFLNYLVDYDVKKRIKVLKEEGREYANITIPYIYNPEDEYGLEQIEDFKATVYNVENGKVVKTKIGKERVFTERINEDYMVAKVAIPQVKVGSVIEYEYRLHSNIFFHIYDWNATDEIPVAFAKYELTIPVIFIYNVETTGLQPLASQVKQGTIQFKTSTNDLQNLSSCHTNIYTCVGRDLQAVKKDRFVWNEKDYYTKVTAELKGINIPNGPYQEVRKTWDQVDDVILSHSDFGGRLNNHSKFRDELEANGIAEISSLQQKVMAVYKLLKQKVAWNGQYELLPRSASEVIKKGNGSNADLNMMLINMLGDVGVKAVPVVMSTRSHGRLPQTYPSLHKLNTFIVGIPNNGTMLYLDASCTDGYLNVLPANLYTAQARIIQKSAKGKWENLQKVGEGKTLVNIKAILTAEGEMKGTASVLYTGNMAAEERKAFRTASDSIAFVTDKARQNSIEITDCKMTDHRDMAPTLKEEYTFIRHGDVTGDHIYINPYPEVPITNNPFLEADRLLPVEFPFKQMFNMTVRLRLPEGWELEEMPKNSIITAKDKSISGDLLCDQDESGELVLQYRFRLNNVVYTNEEYDTLKQLFELFAIRSKDMLVVKKKSK